VLSILAHDGAALRPHDVAGAWNLDPLILVPLLAVAVLYRRGWRQPNDPPWRRAAFTAGVAAVAIAVVSPLDALSGVLVSAHMVQHVLLLVVAAPLLAASAPGAALVRGLPPWARPRLASVRRRLGLDAGRLRRTRAPVVRWVAYTATLWLWHASVLYGAAVEHDVVHALEHVAFLGTGLLVWSAILGPVRVRVPRGLAVLGVFTLGLQTIFLSVLLTFAESPWYEPYVDAAPAWGVDALEDQQLAGVVMWVPAGFIHVGIGLGLLVAMLRELDAGADARTALTRI
jgi:putative membrane protein